MTITTNLIINLCLGFIFGVLLYGTPNINKTSLVKAEYEYAAEYEGAYPR